MRFLVCYNTEKGFHDGNVWGPFSFAVILQLSTITPYRAFLCMN